jgi:hypothetical protein
MKKLFYFCIAFLLAAALWLPSFHFAFQPREPALATAHKLATEQIGLWNDPSALGDTHLRMRRTNPEWDLMGRLFLVLSLSNLSLREPANRAPYLAAMDRIIDDTITQDEKSGPFYFLMAYARNGPFLNLGQRSLFVDGEIALMCGARRMVAESPKLREAMQARLVFVEKSMRAGPLLCAESYPNECWMFCNTVALAALRCGDALDGTDHREFINSWLESARKNLTDRSTGLLVSSFSMDGQVYEGPRGSTIWMVVHCLQLVDPAFAQDQYDRARKLLGQNFLGFGYATEWPRGWETGVDVDSGPVLPFLQASPSASGFALLGAAAFHDDAYLQSLRTSLNFGGFPQTTASDGLRYAASNQVGDAVLLYALVQGPLWAEIKRRTPQ